MKVCACLTELLLKTAYKSKIIKLKLDKYPLNRRICFLTFLESLDMIFSHYKDTCEVIPDYSKIGEDDNTYFEKGLLGIFCMPKFMCIAKD